MFCILTPQYYLVFTLYISRTVLQIKMIITFLKSIYEVEKLIHAGTDLLFLEAVAWRCSVKNAFLGRQLY